MLDAFNYNIIFKDNVRLCFTNKILSTIEIESNEFMQLDSIDSAFSLITCLFNNGNDRQKATV